MALRTILPVAALMSLILVAVGLYSFGYRDGYSEFSYYLGAGAPFATSAPFADTHGVLAAIECHRIGVDVYAVNPCDKMGRIHTYSPVWLYLPGYVSWTPVTGLAVVALFLATLPLLPAAVGSWPLLAVVAGTVSATVVYAIERGNLDLVMFACVAVAIRLSKRSRFLGYALLLLAGALKFYPAAALVVIARERLAIAVIIGLVCVTCLFGVLAIDWADLLRATGALPSGCRTTFFAMDSFGAQRLACGIAQMAGWSKSAAMPLTLLFAAGLTTAAISAQRALSGRVAGLTDLEKTSLLAGAAILVFCFFCVENVLYRGIFVLFALPGMTAIARRPGLVLVVLLLLDWQALLHLLVHFQGAPVSPATLLSGFVVWVIYELLWWFVIAVLAALLLCVLVQSAAWQDLYALCGLLRMKLKWKNHPVSDQTRRRRAADGGLYRHPR